MSPAESAFNDGAGDRDLLTPADREHYQRLYEAQATRSYLYLSLGIGVIAALFPILLVVSGGFVGHDSVSSYYHDQAGPTRDIFVGCLCAIGVFLFLFHGLSNFENWLLNLAGVAIIMVALIPSPGQTGYGSAGLHRGSAIVFFLLIGFVAIFLSKGRVRYIKSAVRRRRFKTAYTVVGSLMILLPLIVATIPVTLFANRSVLLSEFAGTWCFSAYWLIKTYEYRVLLKIRWFSHH